jgi:hypothetical protein
MEEITLYRKDHEQSGKDLVESGVDRGKGRSVFYGKLFGFRLLSWSLIFSSHLSGPL